MFADCDSQRWCVNGGTCAPSTDKKTRTCHCAEGWQGDNCEEISKYVKPLY